MSFDNAAILQHLSSGATSNGASQTDTGLTREAILDYLSTPRPSVNTQQDTMSSAEPYTLGQTYPPNPITPFTDLTDWHMIDDYNPIDIASPVISSSSSGAPSAPPLSDKDLKEAERAQDSQSMYPKLTGSAVYTTKTDGFDRPPAFNPDCADYPALMKLLHTSQPPAPCTKSEQGAPAKKFSVWNYVTVPSIPSIFKRSTNTQTSVAAPTAIPQQTTVAKNSSPASTPVFVPPPLVVASISVDRPVQSLMYPDLAGIHFQIAHTDSSLATLASLVLPPADNNK